MHKTKYGKTKRGDHLGSNLTPEGEKSTFLEKRLSPTAQNHYADLEDEGWCHCKIHQKRYRKKKTKAGVIFDPGWPFEG
jgi:hypothetical protein